MKKKGKNTAVKKGDEIGSTGVSGNANAEAPHLHFVVVKGKVKIDPGKFGYSYPSYYYERGQTKSKNINYDEKANCNPCSM